MKRRRLSRSELKAKIVSLEKRVEFTDERLFASVKLGAQLAEIAAIEMNRNIPLGADALTGADIIQMAVANNEARKEAK